MTSETERTAHQCQCDICQAGTDGETVRHHQQMNVFLGRLNEPQRRWYVGLLSQKPSSASDRQLSFITGLDGDTIRRGRRELEVDLTDIPNGRQRREGGGRLPAEKRPGLRDRSTRHCVASYGG
jgi:hypothetical protein